MPRIVVRYTGDNRDLIRKTQQADNAISGLEQSADRAQTALTGVGAALGGLAAGILAREFIEIADSMTEVENRLRLVTDGTDQLNAAQQALLGISQETRTSFTTNATLYSRLRLATDDLGTSQQDVLDITRILNQQVLIGGSNAQEASAGLIQFGQALASGRLQGDELRSVMENLLGVQQGLIEGFAELYEAGQIDFRVTRANIRELASEGVLTADLITQAILASADATEERFQDLTVTIGGAYQRLSNSVALLVGDINRRTGIGAFLTGSLTGLSDLITENVDNITNAINALTVAIGILAAQRLLGGAAGLAGGILDTAFAGVTQTRRIRLEQDRLLREVLRRYNTSLDAVIAAGLARPGIGISQRVGPRYQNRFATTPPGFFDDFSPTGADILQRQSRQLSVLYAGETRLNRLRNTFADIVQRLRSAVTGIGRFAARLGGVATVLAAVTLANEDFRRGLVGLGATAVQVGNLVVTAFQGIRDAVGTPGELGEATGGLLRTALGLDPAREAPESDFGTWARAARDLEDYNEQFRIFLGLAEAPNIGDQSFYSVLQAQTTQRYREANRERLAAQAEAASARLAEIINANRAALGVATEDLSRYAAVIDELEARLPSRLSDAEGTVLAQSRELRQNLVNALQAEAGDRGITLDELFRDFPGRIAEIRDEVTELTQEAQRYTRELTLQEQFENAIAERKERNLAVTREIAAIEASRAAQERPIYQFADIETFRRGLLDQGGIDAPGSGQGFRGFIEALQAEASDNREELQALQDTVEVNRNIQRAYDLLADELQYPSTRVLLEDPLREDDLRTIAERVTQYTRAIQEARTAPVLNETQDVVSAHLEAQEIISTGWRGVLEEYRTRATDVYGTLGTLAGNITGALTQGLTQLILGTEDALQGLLRSIASVFAQVASQIAVSGLLNLIGVGSLGIGNPNHPNFVGPTRPTTPLTFHQGGRVPGAEGQELLAVVQAGETFRTRVQEESLQRQLRRGRGGNTYNLSATVQNAIEFERLFLGAGGAFDRMERRQQVNNL